MKRSVLMLLATAGAAFAEEAPAEEAAPAPQSPAPSADGRVIYDGAFFARFAPQTANDMVARVPGFTLDEGDDRRGFSGAVGNVLIDGRRPSAKSQSLSSILSRIPASQVAHIELIRDAADTADAAGQSTLVNVVRTPSGGSGVWEAEVQGTEGPRYMPRGEASWSGRFGQLDYSVGASHYSEYRPLDGGRTVRDSAGGLIQRRDDITPRTYFEDSANGDMTFPLAGGSLRVNGQIAYWDFQTVLWSPSFNPAGAPTDDFVFDFHEREQTEEVGFNFDRSFGRVNLELIGLATRRNYNTDESTAFRDEAGAFLGELAQVRRNESGETILRGTLSWPLAPYARFDIGGEAAFNSLDAGLALTEDLGAGPVPVPLPSANVLVEEERAEAFATLVVRPSPRWTIDATLAGETSTLTQTGDTNLETELAYIKPSIQATRRIGARNQVRVRFYRDVDQLDFGDFVSAAGLADDIVFGGNPNLRPETSWRLEAAGDWRYGGDGAISLRAYRHWLEDASDVVPVGPPGMQFDAPGNIGDGWLQGLELNATIPLGFLLPHSRLTLTAVTEESEVTDPATGRPRDISGWRQSRVEGNFRQDLTAQKLAWGIFFYKEAENVTYRLNELDTYEEGPFVDLWVETTAVPNVKIRVYGANLTANDFVRERRFFTPDRNGALDRVEERRRNFGPLWGVRISGTL
ncbi:MAG: TonB-dependent receptor [Alphaproteobacteria bacterium]|nr:TonB-dependent receptor [Alphaproteobacteria bacterium]